MASAALAHCWSAGPTRAHWPTRRSTYACWRVEASASPARGAKRPAATRAWTATSVSRVEDADQARVPAHAESLPEQRERHGIERAGDFDVPIGMDGPLAGREERKRVDGERVQRALLDLDEMRPDLATRRAVNAEARDRPIPLPQERIVGVETVEASALAAHCS